MKNSIKWRMWLRKRLWIIFVVISVVLVISVIFGPNVIREYQLSKLPPQDRRLINAQSSFRIASLKYRWGSRMVDEIERAIGTNTLTGQFANHLAFLKQSSSEELRDASYYASIEVLRVYTDLQERDEAFAKIYLKGYKSKCTFKTTKLGSDGRPLEVELQVPKDFAEEVKSILQEAKTSVVKEFENGSVKAVGAVMDLLREQGIEHVLITRYVGNHRSAFQSLVVLEEHDSKAREILKGIP